MTATSAIIRLLTIILVLSETFAQGQNGGSIRGIVVSEEGIPVKGALVHPDWVTDRPLAGRLPPSAFSDEMGHFVIGWLEYDEYDVWAYDEKQNYPDMFGYGPGWGGGGWRRFYKSPPPPKPRVKLAPQQPAATIEIRLGPKTGALVGTITDAVTGAPARACAGFSDHVPITNLNMGYGLQGEYRFLVPAQADVTVTFWFDRYKPWYYPGTAQASAATTMHFRPGQEKHLDIQLQPDNDVRAQPCGIRLMR